MSKLGGVKRIILIVLVAAIIYGVVRYGTMITSYLFVYFPVSETSVQGASTEKAKEVTGKIGADLGDGFSKIKQQALHISLGDVINGVSRIQKIPQDFQEVQGYLKGQVTNVIESRK